MRSEPRRRPNSSRRLRPGISPGNTDRIPAQATPRASARRTARTGLGLPSRCCAASAGLNWPDPAPQYVHTCFTRFLTGFLKGTVKTTRTPLPMGQTNRRGRRSEQPSMRRASSLVDRRDSPYRADFFCRKSSFSMTIGLPASLA